MLCYVTGLCLHNYIGGYFYALCVCVCVCVCVWVCTRAHRRRCGQYVAPIGAVRNRILFSLDILKRGAWGSVVFKALRY